MSIKNCIFPSKSEKDNYEKLKSKWGAKLRIFHNQPFLNIFDIRDKINVWISKQEFDYLKSTSVDYVLCDNNDKPLLCVEFDGVGKGMNQGANYISCKADSLRRKKMELKLKVAHADQFPFFVVSKTHFNRFDKGEELFMIDCVIGSVLSTLKIRDTLKEFTPEKIGIDDKEFSELNEAERNESIQDWVFNVEIEAEIENNPVCRLSSDLKTKLGITGGGFRFLEHESISGINDSRQRAIALEVAPIIGAESWVKLPNGQKVEGEVWVPNFNTPNYCPFSFIMDLAEYIALRKAEKIIEKWNRTISSKKG